MTILRNLKKSAFAFLSVLLGSNPAPTQVNRALARMPKIRPLHPYPPPNRRPSGVAAARRAAKKRRKAK